MSVELVVLTPADAGEALTLQRAAYVTEAQAHDDLQLPPLVETLAEIEATFAEPTVLPLGLRDGPRLVGVVRVRIAPQHAELGRLAVAPDRQRQGLGSLLLTAAEDRMPTAVREIRLFTGEHSISNLRLYRRHGYVEQHRSPAGSYQLVHLAKVLFRAET